VHPTAVFSKAINVMTLQFTLKNGAGVEVPGNPGYSTSTKTATFTPDAPLSPTTTYTASVSAADSQGNAMESPAQWSFTTDLDPAVVKLFATNAVPATPAHNDSGAVEVGVKFKPTLSGQVVGMRYYQGAGNIGTHTGTLWSASGTQLARVTFPTNANVGWQAAMFSSPVDVTANTTYVVSYHAPNGRYSTNANFFTSAWTTGPLTAPATTNGVYRYTSTPAFPSSSYQATNYWVDPLFLPGSGGEDPPPPDTYGFFGDEDLPANENWNDTQAVELGVKFTSDAAGQVLGVRFYKGPLNTGTHTGTLWSAAGDVLATGTFADESASGWQTLTFGTPVDITAGTTYVVTYNTNVGRYALTANGLSGGLDRNALHIPATGSVYRYGGGFPPAANTSNGNYWVDVVFKPSS
jgi:hypothetical protein